MAIRLLLVSHAATAAMRAARFPADDPLDSRGLADAAAARERVATRGGPAGSWETFASYVSPARCARETALALGLQPTVADELADVDYGDWRGRKLAEVAADAPQALASWTQDPDAYPPGGESFSELVIRVGTWLATLSTLDMPEKNDAPCVIAVTHATVIRAALVHALGIAPAGFARIEIAPLSMLELRRSTRGWTGWPSAPL